MSKLMELVGAMYCAMLDGDRFEVGEKFPPEIERAVAELERDAARYAHIISRITQSELETVIRRDHDDDGEYTAGLVQMIDAAMEAANVPEL